MLSYISFLSSFSFIVWIVTKLGMYHNHYIARAVRFEEAKVILRSTACTDPENRIVLSERCNEATRILYTKPWVGAIFDTAADLQIPLINNLHKYVIGAVILALVLIYAGVVQIGRDRQESQLNHWRLPIKVDHVD